MTLFFSCDGSTIGEAPKSWDGRAMSHTPWGELTTADTVLCCMKQDTRTAPASYMEKLTGARKRFNADQVWADGRTKLDALYTRPASTMPPTSLATLLSGAIVAQHFRDRARKQIGASIDDGCVVVLVLGERLGRGHARVAVGYGFNQSDELTVSVIHGVVDEQSVKIGVAGESSPFIHELVRKFPTTERAGLSAAPNGRSPVPTKLRRLAAIDDERIIIVEHAEIEAAAETLKAFAYRTDIRATASAESGRRRVAFALLTVAAATGGYAAWEYVNVQRLQAERTRIEAETATLRGSTQAHLDARPFEVAWRGGYQPQRLFQTAETLWRRGTQISIKAGDGTPPVYQVIAPRERAVQQGVMAASSAKEPNSPEQIRGFVRATPSDQTVRGTDVMVSQEGRSFQKEFVDGRNEIEADLRVDLAGGSGARSR